MSLMPVEEARTRILKGAAPLDTETVRLMGADGLVLAEDVAATRTQPPFAASAMDGYAVRAADVGSVPVDLKVTGEIPAGVVHPGRLGPGDSLLIFPPPPLPLVPSSIVLLLHTPRPPPILLLPHIPPVGDHIRTAGSDFPKAHGPLKA